MSYCRFTEGDVYAYECDGGVQFYVADGNRELDRLCCTFNEAYQYVMALRDTHGLDVPSHAIEALKADALEEAARICGPDSAVAELEAENDKLRELVEDMLDCIEIRAAWHRPPTEEMYEEFAQRAGELGIEVDG